MERMTKTAELVELTDDENPHKVGRTWVCSVCGTHIRTGQLHATEVWPAHANYQAAIVYDRLSKEWRR